MLLAIALITLISAPFESKAGCEAPFTGEFIVCAEQEDEFWRQVAENCDGVIYGPVSVVVINCTNVPD